MTALNANDFKQLVLKIENIQSEKDEISEHLKDAFAEAKSRGYDIKTLKTVLSLRKKDPDTLRHEEEMLETYRAAIGI